MNSYDSNSSSLSKMLLELTYTWFAKDKLGLELNVLNEDFLQFTITRIYGQPCCYVLPEFGRHLALIYITSTMFVDIFTALCNPEVMRKEAANYKPSIWSLPEAIKNDVRTFLKPFLPPKADDPERQDLFFIAGLIDGVINPMFAEMILRDFTCFILNMSVPKELVNHFNFVGYRNRKGQKNASIKAVFGLGDKNAAKGKDTESYDLQEFEIHLPVFRSVDILNTHKRVELTESILGQLTNLYHQQLRIKF